MKPWQSYFGITDLRAGLGTHHLLDTGFCLPTMAVLASSESALCACARYTGFFSGFWFCRHPGDKTGGADWR
jgi:hypothetical protein